jgi:hypothetical protein
MSERDRKAAEATFDKRQKRESEIAGVLIQENARRDAAVKNMQRLIARCESSATRKIRACGKSALDEATWSAAGGQKPRLQFRKDPPTAETNSGGA